MSALNLFIPIIKADAAQRLVYGVVTAERPDRSGEICDYATTKPFYEKWSRDIAKATDGKSLGNLRAMHSKVAAGKITSLGFDDAEKQIEICAKVVDADEWNKVVEGVYTGFSQGGVYVKRWTDEDGLTRYTADPSEVSFVDLPCLSEATFQMIKTDGVIERVKFRSGNSMSEDWEQVWRSKHDGATFSTQAELQAHLGILQVEKIGARHNKDDAANLQAAHDSLVAMGAKCHGADKAHGAQGDEDALTKIATENENLRKTLLAIVPVLDEILQCVKGMDGRPRPSVQAAASQTTSKSDASAVDAAEAERIAKFFEQNRAAVTLEAFKSAHRQPKRMGAAL